MASQTDQDYFRSVSSESEAYMMGSANGRRDATSKLWVPMVVTVIVVLQIASTTGLFVYLNMSISEVKVQSVKEELRCLSLLSALDQDQEIPQHLVHLFGEPCMKLAEGIKSYISKVTENLILKHTFQAEPRARPHAKSPAGPQRPSAHLTLRDSGGSASTLQAPQPDLHQSCRHPLRSWSSHTFGAHLHNMTLSNGRLRVPQDGRYFLYAQVYFLYPTPSEGDQGSTSHQLIQCVYKKTSYFRPIQLLKGVGTKCWAMEAEYGLHSIYQAGLFELRAGDELFVSVSSPGTVHADETSSYFGAFRLDL